MNKRPRVSLAETKRAAALDPSRSQGEGISGSTDSVETFENALALLGLLNRKYVDGSYGTATLAAVERFQRNIGDDADGVPGPLELKSLAIRSGAFEAAPWRCKHRVETHGATSAGWRRQVRPSAATGRVATSLSCRLFVAGARTHAPSGPLPSRPGIQPKAGPAGHRARVRARHTGSAPPPSLVLARMAGEAGPRRVGCECRRRSFIAAPSWVRREYEVGQRHDLDRDGLARAGVRAVGDHRP
ncbi:peptidoglycan-binding domain-containing protein [Terrabacter sp. 2YAF2]|uniref:peptidoglycan-binding domain-containing protein n=1 Tax=Terrabacter sp. 2YAF2 TaxID=3233026 RepID=UPI003F9DCDDE